jgi:uncharacterized protein (DUF488 family)
MRLFTIGFTQKPAERFFGSLAEAGVERVLDVRLSNRSQLAGFAKRDDLRYFLAALVGVDYRHVPDLAPTRELLDAHRHQELDWPAYERRFLELMRVRQVETSPRAAFDRGCLLCSEHLPDRCHRRLVAQYLASHWPEVEVVHLL